MINGKATGVEIIQDPYHIQKLYTNLVRSAKNEILLLLPTTSAFTREHKIGIIQSLQDASKRGVKIRLLTAANERISSESQSMLLETANVTMRYIRGTGTVQTPTDPRTKIIVVDRQEYLIVELKDDSKDTFVEAVSLAIYSGNPSTVISYISVFESLWKQSELYDQLEAHDKTQREFINIAAHELRTPMQPLISLAEQLEEDLAEGIEEIKISRLEIEILARNAKRLTQLTSNLLEVSRIDNNSLILRKEKVDLNEKIRTVIQDCKVFVEEDQRIDIVFEESVEDHIIVDADKSRLFEVLSNLIRNAINFTKEGTIAVKLRQRDSDAEVSVEDTGKGIDPSIFSKLFEKFTTKSEKGTGLGLYIAKNIVEAHGGQIWAENNPYGGATFTFTLPIRALEKLEAATK